MNYEDEYGIEACKESVIFAIETLHEDPIRMLGKFTLRAKQDIFFNKTMIEALILYIEEHDIKWSD